jgi:hypothetical protein
MCRGVRRVPDFFGMPVYEFEAGTVDFVTDDAGPL